MFRGCGSEPEGWEGRQCSASRGKRPRSRAQARRIQLCSARCGAGAAGHLSRVAWAAASCGCYTGCSPCAGGERLASLMPLSTLHRPLACEACHRQYAQQGVGILKGHVSLVQDLSAVFTGCWLVWRTIENVHSMALDAERACLPCAGRQHEQAGHRHGGGSRQAGDISRGV